MIKLVVIRHAETGAEAKGITLGSIDWPLSEEGRRRAHQTSNALKAMYLKFDYIYTSPLKRALETAEIINKISQAKVDRYIVSPLIRERDFGELNGLTFPEFELKYPELVKENTPTFQPNLPSGESIDEVTKRVKTWISQIKKLDLEDSSEKPLTVFAVTHTGIIRILKRMLSDQTAEESRSNDPGNLGLTEFEIK